MIVVVNDANIYREKNVKGGLLYGILYKKGNEKQNGRFKKHHLQ